MQKQGESNFTPKGVAFWDIYFVVVTAKVTNPIQ
jgi:hypothetical protein